MINWNSSHFNIENPIHAALRAKFLLQVSPACWWKQKSLV